MKLNGKLNRELNTACWTKVWDVAHIEGITLFNFHERSELTSTFTSILTSK